MGLKRCRLKAREPKRLLEFVVLEVTARAAADLMGLQVNAAALFYRNVRMMISEKLEAEALELAGEVELDEIYFGGVRKGTRGRGAAPLDPVMVLVRAGSMISTRPTPVPSPTPRMCTV